MTQKDKVSAIFSDIIAEGRPIEPNKPRDSYENWDSLANMNLMIAINDEFDHILEIEDLEKFTSFEAIVELVDSKV